MSLWAWNPMEMPLRVKYEVTDLGRNLQGTLDSLASWMQTHGEDLRGAVV